MRFRRLTLEELEHLKDEFVTFLASQTITAIDWEKIKKDQPNKVDELIETFSDFVMHKVYSKIELLEQRESESIVFFHFSDSEMSILSVVSPDHNVDFISLDESDELDSIPFEGFMNKKKMNFENILDEIHKLTLVGCFMGRSTFYEKLLNRVQ